MAVHEIIMAGARYGRWTVVAESPDRLYGGSGGAGFLCRCACGATKTIFRFSLTSGRSRSCGCIKAEQRLAFHVAPGEKLCPGCKAILPLSVFHPRPERGPNAVRPRCKECMNGQRTRAREKEAPDERQRALSLARKWKRDDKDHAANMELDARKEKIRVRERARWKQSPKPLAGIRRYQARKRDAMPSWADKFLIEEVYDLCRLRNVYRTCGVKWVVDHAVPLHSSRVCGLHVQDNLCVIPNVDNIRKGNRHWPDMWPREP